MNYPKYTTFQKNKVLQLFYRTELRFEEKIIDNTTPMISKETGIKKLVVDEIITKDLDAKFKRLFN